MSPNDPELPVQDLPRMVPDREDIARRKMKASNPRPSKIPDDDGGNSSLPGWVLFFLFLIVGAIGFLFWKNIQLSDQLSNSVMELRLSDARIRVLEGQLSATGENLVVNEANIKAQFGNQMSEIRKLWDVTNKRNKVWIQDNQTAVATLKKQMSANQDKLVKTEQLVHSEATKSNELRANLAKTSTVSAKNSDTLKAQQASISSIQSRLDELSLSQSLLSDQIRSLAVNELTKKISDLDSQLVRLSERIDLRQGEVEQDIASINNHRLQVNQRLSSLQEQLMVIETRLITQQQ